MENTEWDESIPFRKISPILKVFSSLPTLPLHEWSCRLLLAVIARHAFASGKIELLASAGMSAIAAFLLAHWSNRLKTAKHAPLVKFPAQANFMLTPRQSLHELEFTTCALYLSFLAARRHGGVQRTRIAEACFAGLLCHLFSAPSNVNGPRFLWWTWHEDHPSVRERILNFPASQALLELCGGFTFSLLGNWILDFTPEYTQKPATVKLVESVKTMFTWLPTDNKRVVETVASGLDSVQQRLADVHPVARVLALASVFPVLQYAGAIVSQIVSLDTVGQPSARSYKFLVAALALVASRSEIVKTNPMKIVDSNMGHWLASFVAAYFATQAMISFVGEPDKHVSTGAHQTFGRSMTVKRDTFGNTYRAYVASEIGTHGFTVEGVTRASLHQDLQDKRESLEDVAKFRKAADKRVGDTELALQETLAWSKQTLKNVPHLGENEFSREMEASNSVRVARIKAHLEDKLERVKLERRKIGQFEQKLRAKIARLEDTLELGSVDPSGNAVVPASEFGPQSVWYTIRGVNNADGEETVGVCLLSALGVLAFTKSLALGT